MTTVFKINSPSLTFPRSPYLCPSPVWPLTSSASVSDLIGFCISWLLHLRVWFPFQRAASHSLLKNMNRVWHFFVYTSLVGFCLHWEQLHLLISFTKPHVTCPQPSLWIYVTVPVVLSALTLVSYCCQQTKILFLPSPLTLLVHFAGSSTLAAFLQASIWLLGSFPFKFYSLRLSLWPPCQNCT